MALESNINGLWASKQTAKGSPASMVSATKRFRWVGGDVQTNRADGSENWADGTLFGDTVDFVNTILGNGAPVVQGQSGPLAYLGWLASGQETVTGGTNEVQTLALTGAPTAGTFTISVLVGGVTYTTAGIAFNAAAAAVAAAVALLPPFTASQANATITGGGGPLPGSNVTLTFSGGLAAQTVPLLTVNTTGLTGGTGGTITRTTVGAGYQHVITPADTGGFWSTFLKSVGKTTIHRSQYNDCRITALRIEGSSASKVVKATPTFISLDPGMIPAADPTKGDDGTRPFIYTEAQGTFTIDGQVYTAHSAFALALTWGLQEWYGDDVVPADVINTRAIVNLEGVTILLDSAGLTRYNQQIYNTPNPATNARPVKTIPALGSYSAQFNKNNPYTGMAAEVFKLEVPSVKWSPDLNIPANPDGGAVEFPLAGEFRKAAGQPPFRLTVTTPYDAAFTG